MIEVEDFLEHHGVKGQKWGVRRKAKRLAKQQGQVDVLKRVASGKASTKDKAKSLTMLTGYRLAKGRGLAGGARLTLDAQLKQQKAVLAGEKKAVDLIAKYGKLYIRELDYSH